MLIAENKQVMRLSELWNNSQPRWLASVNLLTAYGKITLSRFYILFLSLFKSYWLAKENTISHFRCIHGSMNIFNALFECCDQERSLLHKTAPENTPFGRMKSIFILPNDNISKSPNDNISNDNISLVYCTNSKDIVLATRTWNAYLLSLYRRTLGVKLTQNWKEHAKNVPKLRDNGSLFSSRKQANHAQFNSVQGHVRNYRSSAPLSIHIKITENFLENVFFSVSKQEKRKYIHFRLSIECSATRVNGAIL